VGTIVAQDEPPKAFRPTTSKVWYLVSDTRIVRTTGYSFGENDSWWHFIILWPPYNLDFYKGVARLEGRGEWDMVASIDEALAKLRGRVIKAKDRCEDILKRLDEGTFIVTRIP